MRTKLAVIALSGFAVAVACLGAAGALDAGKLADSIAGFGDSNLPRCDLSLTGQQATRKFNWDGSDTAGVAVPASVHYHRGQGDQLVVTGDGALVSHVRLTKGTVEFDCHALNLKGARLDVILPGRSFSGFDLAGKGELALDGIDQSDLKIRVAGAGNVTANGRAERLELQVAGASDARLDGLSVDHLTLQVAGSGNVEAAPKDELYADILGSGTVTLRSEPRRIQTNVLGSGRIIHPDGSVSSGHI
jgi:Putative auto-transporter adhesin, head GIN domain